MAVTAGVDFTPETAPEAPSEKADWTPKVNDLFELMSGSSEAEAFTDAQHEELLVAILGAGGMAQDQMQIVLPGVQHGGKKAMLKMIQDLTRK